MTAAVRQREVAEDLWPPRTRFGLDPHRPGELVARLERLRERGAGEAGGPPPPAHLLVLDLGQVRARLGPRWPASRAKVLAHAEACVAQRLVGEEVYLVVDETTLWVFSVGERWSEVDERGHAIAAEITRRLLGVLPAGVAVGVRTLPLDLAAAFDGVAGFESLSHRIARERARAAEAERRVFADHAERLVAFYRPILSLAKPRVVGHRIFARLQGTGGELVRPETVCPQRAAGGFVAALDAWLAARVAEQLPALAAAGERALLMLPVSPTTLAEPAWRRSWWAPLEPVAEAAAGRLALELVDPEPRAPPPRLAELAPELARLVRLVVVRCPLDPDLVAGLGGQEERGVSFDAGGLDPLAAETADRLAAVAAACRAAGLRSLVINVGSAALAERARAAGIDYLAGDACLPPRRRPGRLVDPGGER